MNAGELLAKVTARAVPLEQSASAFGRYTQEDVLHALGLIAHPTASILIRVKYCHQTELLPDLDLYFWQATVNKALEQGWSYPRKMEGKEFFRNIGRLALSENINPNICLECGGTGKAILNDLLSDCLPCRGSGRSSHPEAARARLIGMPYMSWKNTWADRYRHIQGIADAWESIGLGGVQKRLQTA